MLKIQQTIEEYAIIHFRNSEQTVLKALRLLNKLSASSLALFWYNKLSTTVRSSFVSIRY